MLYILATFSDLIGEHPLPSHVRIVKGSTRRPEEAHAHENNTNAQNCLFSETYKYDW